MDTHTVRETLDPLNNPSIKLLFVYGTLLGQSGSTMSEYLYRNSSTVGYGFFLGKLFQLDGYPGAVYGLGRPGASPVYGAILELNKPEVILPELDKYEETGPPFPEPYEYIRRVIPVHSDKAGQTLDCWVYLYNRDTTGLSEIPGGRYIHAIRGLNELRST